MKQFAISIVGVVILMMIGMHSARIDTNFDYESATYDERMTWLEKQAESIGRQVDRGLPKGRGNAPHMSVYGTVANPKSNSISVHIRIKGPYMRIVSDREMNRKVRADLCPLYLDTPVGRRGIQLKHVFRSESGKKAAEFVVSPEICNA